MKISISVECSDTCLLQKPDDIGVMLDIVAREIAEDIEDGKKDGSVKNGDGDTLATWSLEGELAEA